MSKTGGQLARAVKRSAVEWDEQVADPREKRGQRHKHRGLLNLLVLGFASGRSTLRRIEELGADLSVVAKRVLGLARAASDTTLYNLLSWQKVEGLRETLVAQVKKLWRNNRIGNDLFPLGVVSLDGKSVWGSSWKHIDGAKEMETESGVIYSSLAMLNAVLVSSSARPCLDLQLIREKSGESPAFREMVRRVGNAFFSMFDVVMGDAGLMCRENATVIRGLAKHYVFTVKGNQQRLFGLASELFATYGGPAPFTTQERRAGATITRVLETMEVSDVDGFGIYGAQELWRVIQMTVSHTGKATAEVRFFITSLPSHKLTRAEKLALVRLHWGIENNRHWTLDVAFEEDDRQPCQLSRRSVEVVCWLRALAYNVVASLRSAAAEKDRRPQPWRRTMEMLRDLLIFAPPEELAAHLA